MFNQFRFAELNFSNPALRSYLVDTTKFWATAVGIDGCRSDLANTVPLSFWAMLNNELKKVKPGWLMVGEVPYDLKYAGTYSGPGFRPGETYHHVYGFDAIYGVEYMKALRGIVAGLAPASSLVRAYTRPDGLRAAAPAGTVLYRGVDNHDQSPRAVKLKGGNAGMLARDGAELHDRRHSVCLQRSGDRRHRTDECVLADLHRLDASARPAQCANVSAV